MTGATFLLELRRSRALFIWLAAITFAYAATMGLFYPVMRENMAALEEYMKIFPKEFMAAFGMTGSLGQPGVFFQTYIGIWLWPILAAIVGILAATRPVAADLDRGFLELVISTPMSRRRYLGVAILVQALVIVAIALATVGGVLVVGSLVGAGFDAGRFLLVVPLATAFGCAIAAVATLLSVVTLSRGQAAAITVVVLLGMYLMYVVSQIQGDLDWLLAFSAFGHFDTAAIIDDGVVPAGDLALFSAVAVACWLGGLWAFGRRDLAA
jgi:ABC-2 type transport system permease protein